MNIIFNSWNRGYYELCSEKATLSLLDGFNKTRYSRRKNQEGLLELASKEAHRQKKVYFATIYDEQTPYCFLECNEGYFYVGFLDEKLRVFLSYKFDEFELQKLFLKEVMAFYFEDSDKDSNRASKYQFETDGNFKIIEINYRENEQEILTAKNPLSREILSHLWVDYPEFGKYDELIKIDRVPSEVFEK